MAQTCPDSPQLIQVVPPDKGAGVHTRDQQEEGGWTQLPRASLGCLTPGPQASWFYLYYRKPPYHLDCWWNPEIRDKSSYLSTASTRYTAYVRSQFFQVWKLAPTQHASAPKRPALLTCLAFPFISPGFSQEGLSKPPVGTTPHDHSECRTVGRFSLEEGLSTSKKHVHSWKYKGVLDGGTVG